MLLQYFYETNFMHYRLHRFVMYFYMPFYEGTMVMINNSCIKIFLISMYSLSTKNNYILFSHFYSYF
jgi:hypothetical protein